MPGHRGVSTGGGERVLEGVSLPVAYRRQGQGTEPPVLLTANLGGSAWHPVSC